MKTLFTIIFAFIAVSVTVEGGRPLTVETGTHDPPLPIDCDHETASAEITAFCVGQAGGLYQHPTELTWIVSCGSGFCSPCNADRIGVLQYLKRCDQRVSPFDHTDPSYVCVSGEDNAGNCETSAVVGNGCPPTCLPGQSSVTYTQNPESNFAQCQCVWGVNKCRNCAHGTRWNAARECCA